MDPTPIHLAIENDTLVINWSDASRQFIRINDLRQKCPCAKCRDQREENPKALELSQKRDPLPVLPSQTTGALNISKMEPVGNYAYNIHFTDGHSQGLFTFEFLKSFAND